MERKSPRKQSKSPQDAGGKNKNLGDQLNSCLNNGNARKSEERIADSRKSSEIIEDHFSVLMGDPHVHWKKPTQMPCAMNVKRPRHNILNSITPRRKRETLNGYQKDRNHHGQRND